jgi:23S rRNA (adenine2030-N6)-methyltransferase
VFIDPSYELKKDYHEVVTTLIQMHKRFATGCYALWYPVIERERVQKMEDTFKNSGIHNIELFELGICAEETTRGMTGCGMIVINPPWTLKNTMQEALPWLASTLTQDQIQHFRLSTLAPESSAHAEEN